jgi:hypothetical protein
VRLAAIVTCIPAIAVADLRPHVPMVPPAPSPKVTRCVFAPMLRPYIVREQPRVVRCAELARRAGVRPIGRYVATFWIDAVGRVVDARADGPDLDLAQCIAHAMTYARFPASLGRASVSYPWTLAP